MRTIYISFYSLASRTRVDAVELIVRKYLLLWWSFCVLKDTFYSVMKLQDKNKFKCTTKLQDINDNNLNGSEQNLTEVTLVR